MASNDHDELDTDDSKDEDSDSFLIVGIRPIQETRLNTVEDLMKELEICKIANVKLHDQLSRLTGKVLTSERKFRNERTLHQSKKDELMNKNNDIQEAKVKFENMRKRNTALLVKIKEYENIIKVLESNEKELQTKPAAFKDKTTKKLIESESKKTEDNEKELLDLKKRLQDLETEFEADSKNNETLERNTQAVNEFQSKLSEMAEESKKKDATMALIVENMEQKFEEKLDEKMTQLLFALQSNNPGQEDKKTNNSHDRSRERGTKLPPIKSNGSKSQEKPKWRNASTGGSPKK